MKLSISNIAWLDTEEQEAYAVLKQCGVNYLEIAPGRFGLNPKNFNGQGLQVVAMQALLFGKPHFGIFDDETRPEMLEYLKTVIDFGNALGAKTLVFGSPKNRRMGDVPREKAYKIAEEFFSQIGDYSAKFGMKFCIEANPAVYGTDFINTTQEAFDFYTSLNNQGIGFHLDTGALTMNKESSVRFIENYCPQIQHVHISEPYLKMIGAAGTRHKLISDALKANGYANFASIEMTNSIKPDNIEAVKEAIGFCKNVYGLGNS